MIRNLLLTIAIWLFSTALMAQTATKPEGSGTENNPYQIATWQNLYWLSQQKDNFQEWGKSYIQTADIDFADAEPAINTWNGGKGWEPIGYYAMPDPARSFTGYYNGQGYTIKNLYIDATETYAALFAYTENATIVNLGLVDVDVTGAIGMVAALVSEGSNTTVEKCYSTGSMTNTGDWTAGGLVASNGGTITNSYSTASVTGKEWTGGFVGNNSSGTIENCYSAGNVTSSGSEGIGGFVGSNTYYDNVGTVINSYWDTQTSEQTESGGDEQGKTTAEMKQQSTFTNWDFDKVWALDASTNNGYPHLQFAEPTNETPEAIMPEGYGSEESPFLIATWQNLYWLSQNPNYWFDENNYNPYYFEQTADIDLANATPAIETWGMGRGWLPIGKEKEFDLDHDSKAFKSVYNGKGYAIKNLYINRPTQDNVGLFGYTEYAVIKNIKLENVNITGKDNVGAVVGKYTGISSYNNGFGVFSSSASGSITGGENVGGIVGNNEDGYIEKSHSSVTVNGEWKVGGLVGLNARKAGSTNTESHIVDCYSTGNVVATGTSEIGGLVGSNFKSEIKNSFSVGTISAPEQQQGYAYSLGGLVGYDSEGTIINSYWDTETSGFATSDGGEGKTTAQMKVQSTYTDWDFVMVWQISETVNNGYPSYVNYEPQGEGTVDNPYQIATWHNLKWISDNAEEWNKHFLQTANIEFPEAIKDWDNGKGWSPIGNSTYNFFSGVYNGQSFTISNLYINRDDDFIGLFGNVEANEGKLINIKIIDADISGSSYVGALAGKIYWTSVDNCHSSGNVDGFSHVGGLVGSYIWTEKMIGCTSSADVHGLSRIGGLIGHLGGNGDTGGVDNCSSTGNVEGEEFVGGFAGEGSGARIFASHSNGNVSGKDDVGGFIGTAEGGSIKKCYSTGLVTGSPDANSNESYNIGGFIGTVNNSATIENTYATGNVSGCNNVGGFVGYNYESQIKYSYSIGSVTANVSNAGGFAAVLDDGTITASFWDTETSERTESDGGEGKTTAEMKESSTYTNAGWDFENVWGISAAENNGYPTFSVKHTLTITIVGEGVVKVNNEEYTTSISVDPGTTLNLEAIANNGWQFEGWTGSVAEALEATTTITMNEDKTVYVTFVEESPAEHTITFTITDGTNPIQGASIAINSQTIPTNSSGVASIELPDGSYPYTITLNQYETYNGTIEVNGDNVAENVSLVFLSAQENILSDVSIGPNPFSNSITITNAGRFTQIVVVNTIGQTVIQQNNHRNNTVVLSTQSLNKGIYLVILKTAEGKTIARKVIKQ
ncbi:MAG: T9SS type A sorting domain-containing protein [Bacteroidales bacterium]|nr:T9SS type A sorting domain-containing protein [Bacteroidales bacterium]MBN2748884.1 T9SS type A sorting domain-containing protein [Bacteroidales bacterium]